VARTLPRTARRALIPFLLTTFAGVVTVIAVGAIALITLTETDPVAVLQQAKLLPFVGALGCFVLSNLLVGFRFRALLLARDKSEIHPALGGWTLGSLFFAGNVFTLIIPGPAGEIAALTVLHRQYGVAARDGLAISVHTRFVGLACGAFVASIAIPFTDVGDLLGQVLVGAALLMIGGGLALGIASAQPSWARILGRTALSVVARLDKWGLERIAKPLQAPVALFAKSLLDIWSVPKSAWLAVVLWSLLMQAILVLGLWLTALSLGLSPAWPGLFLGQGLGSLAVLVTLIMPGGLGSYEATFIASMMAGGGLLLAQAGALTVAARLIHLLGLVASGLAFGAWAGPLWQAEVQAAVRRGHLDIEE
jgi:uncharacterized membrane protein YbhN (UPF0104 family)